MKSTSNKTAAVYQILQQSQTGKTTTITSAKRLSDGEIFTIGDKTRDCLVKSFLIDQNGNLLIITDEGNVTPISDAEKMLIF